MKRFQPTLTIEDRYLVAKSFPREGSSETFSSGFDPVFLRTSVFAGKFELGVGGGADGASCYAGWLHDSPVGSDST